MHEQICRSLMINQLINPLISQLFDHQLQTDVCCLFHSFTAAHMSSLMYADNVELHMMSCMMSGFKYSHINNKQNNITSDID